MGLTIRPALALALTLAAAACATSSGTGSGSGGGAAGGGARAGAIASSPTVLREKVAVGQSEQEVLARLGPPSAEGLYTTRMARLLSVVGARGPHRTYFYRRAGRVLFEGGNAAVRTGRVVKVEEDADEPGTAR